MKKIITFILIFLISILFFVSINPWTNLEEEIVPDIVEDIELIEEEVEEPVEKKATATILATGDIMFHIPQVNSAYILEEQAYNFIDVFKYTKKYISSADISIGNFETVAYGNELGFSGYPRFNSPTETLTAIKDAGFDILNTANNHAIDQGRDGIINTIDNIQNNGMKNIGTYKDDEKNIYIEEINEIKIAFLSYSYGFNGLDSLLTEEEQAYMVNTIDEDKIKEDLQLAKLEGSDLVVVYIHWGNEYQTEPSEYQIELGRKMVEWGANIILGSHPHVIQKSEIIEHNGKDNFIIYSMGNFLSNQRASTMGNSYTEDGIMVKIEVEKDFLAEETTIKDIEYIPTWVRLYKEGDNKKYAIIPIEDSLANEELNSLLNDSEKMRINSSFEDTMEVMFEY